jgi:hypothetical protein
MFHVLDTNQQQYINSTVPYVLAYRENNPPRGRGAISVCDFGGENLKRGKIKKEENVKEKKASQEIKKEIRT